MIITSAARSLVFAWVSDTLVRYLDAVDGQYNVEALTDTLINYINETGDRDFWSMDPTTFAALAEAHENAPVVTTRQTGWSIMVDVGPGQPDIRMVEVMLTDELRTEEAVRAYFAPITSHRFTVTAIHTLID